MYLYLFFTHFRKYVDHHKCSLYSNKKPHLREARPIGTRDARLALLPIADEAARTMIASHARRGVVTPDARIARIVRVAALAQRRRCRRIVAAAGTVLDEAAQMGDFATLMGDIVAQLLHNGGQVLNGLEKKLWGIEFRKFSESIEPHTCHTRRALGKPTVAVAVHDGNVAASENIIVRICRTGCHRMSVTAFVIVVVAVIGIPIANVAFLVFLYGSNNEDNKINMLRI